MHVKLIRNAFKYTFSLKININYTMPRQQTLANITPNKYYSLDANLKYIHKSQNFITAIIQQEDTQSKIRIPSSEMEIEEGRDYRFGKCFYSRNGWIYARQPSQTIQSLQENHAEPMTIDQIYLNRGMLNNKYVTTLLKVIQVEPKQTFSKHGKDLTLNILHCYGSGMLIDITLWNRQIDSQSIKNLWVVFSGFRLKPLTSESCVLASTVYSKLDLYHGNLIGEDYSLEMNYNNISCAYQTRTISEINRTMTVSDKSFSVLTAISKAGQGFEYDGCSICKKKLNAGVCPQCGNGIQPAKFRVARVILCDNTGQLQVLVFDDKIQKILMLANKNSKITAKIKSSIKMTPQGPMTSHIISNIENITF